MLQPPSESTTTSGPDASPAEIEAARRAALCDSERADAIAYDWMKIYAGISLAGGLYPFALFAFYVLFAALAIVWGGLIRGASGLSAEDIVKGFFLLFGVAAVSSMCGILLSGFVTALTLPVIYSIAWSLRLRTNIVWLGAFSGGLVGFICALPIALGLPSIYEDFEFSSFAAAALLGPGLATIVGQLGGAWGGMKSRETGAPFDWREFLATIPNRRTVASTRSIESGEQSSEPPQPSIQFSIRQLLWVAVWLSLLLTLIRLCGIPYELMLPLLVGWLLYQLTTLAIGRRLMQRISSWRERRIASTSPLP